MMVAKENETKTPRPQMWINVHFDNSLSFLSLNFFASTCSHFYFYFSAFFLYTSNNITNISVRTTQMRAHMHTYDRSSYSSCTFFFMLIRSFFLLLQSLFLVYFFFFFTFVRVREHTYMYDDDDCAYRRIEEEEEKERKKQYEYDSEDNSLSPSVFLLSIE